MKYTFLVYFAQKCLPLIPSARDSHSVGSLISNLHSARIIERNTRTLRVCWCFWHWIWFSSTPPPLSSICQMFSRIYRIKVNRKKANACFEYDFNKFLLTNTPFTSILTPIFFLRFFFFCVMSLTTLSFQSFIIQFTGCTGENC